MCNGLSLAHWVAFVWSLSVSMHSCCVNPLRECLCSPFSNPYHWCQRRLLSSSFILYPIAAVVVSPSKSCWSAALSSSSQNDAAPRVLLSNFLLSYCCICFYLRNRKAREFPLCPMLPCCMPTSTCVHASWRNHALLSVPHDAPTPTAAFFFRDAHGLNTCMV